MALRHFLRLERQVRVGGFGPPRHRFGGRWYAVGPVSVMGWVQLSAVLRPLSLKGALGPEFGETFKSLPREVSGALLPLLLSQRPRPRDMTRVTPDQLSAAWEAFCQVNDLAYIRDAFKAPEDGPKSDEPGLDMVDMAVQLSQRLGGARPPEEILRIPMQTFLALFDSLRHLHNVGEGRPAECDAPTDAERQSIKDAFAGTGIEVQ